jgi:hypothetical protein
MIANGTALGAFRASSLICTLVSKPAEGIECQETAGRDPFENDDQPTVQAGAKKLNMNAYPLGHPDT